MAGDPDATDRQEPESGKHSFRVIDVHAPKRTSSWGIALFRSAQTDTGPRATLAPATTMFLTIGLVVILAAMTLLLRPRATAKSEVWMSERWLAEHRAAHTS